MVEWLNGRVDGWTDEWMGGWMYVCKDGWVIRIDDRKADR
jgi:hypothetical protein